MQTNKPKYTVFQPNRNTNPVSVSTFRTPLMNKDEHQKALDAISKNGKPIGSTELLVETVHKIGLLVKPEEESFRWHADIVNWPDGKSERKQLALDLAKVASEVQHL